MSKYLGKLLDTNDEVTKDNNFAQGEDKERLRDRDEQEYGVDNSALPSTLPVWNATFDPECFPTYCYRTRCQKHRIIDHNVTVQQETSSNNDSNNREEDEKNGCKTLWFTGMHEAPPKQGEGYKRLYGAALNSAKINANDSLQPVLMLGRLDMEDLDSGTNNVTAPSKFRSWVKERGAIVITLPNLSFQHAVDRHYNNNQPSHRQGPWLRLEIPRLIEEHGLFDLPNICQEHVLYTDSDVLFANKISKTDIRQLTDELSSSGAAVSYGREFEKLPHISNTGVMLIDVAKFGAIIPEMVKLLEERGPFGAFDQGLINAFFEQNKNTNVSRHMLNIYYNWKPYWKVEPSSFDDIKIIHIHGPKPGSGLEAIALCDLMILKRQVHNFELFERYKRFVTFGICCDSGRTAVWFFKSMRLLYPAPEHID